MIKRSHRFLLPLLGLALLVSGCSSNTTHAEKGAGIGAIAGAVIGGVIGAQTGDAGKGAAVGAIFGASVGAVAGNEKDKEEARLAELERQKQAKQAAWEREQALMASHDITDEQVLEAELRALRLEEELARIEFERQAAQERLARLEEAERRAAEAEAELASTTS